MVKNDSELSVKQRRAVRSLLTRPTIALAAADAEVSESALYRWLREDTFCNAVSAAEEEAIDTASRRLVGLAEAAIGVLTVLMADKNMHPAIRLRAAIAVLEQMLRLRELRTIEQRLSELEARLAQP